MIAKKAVTRSQKRAPEETRRNILAAAEAEFSEKGLAGARVDDIAARTRTTKRMIYYYFGSKENLYAAVLERLYGGMRDAEKDLNLTGLRPAEALQKIVEITFDHHAAHPEFVRLVCTENINEARIVSASPTIRSRNATIIGILKQILEKGAGDGSFRRGLDPLDVHLLISSFCFYRVSNRHTLRAIFGRDLQVPKVAAAHRRLACETVLRYVSP